MRNMPANQGRKFNVGIMDGQKLIDSYMCKCPFMRPNTLDDCRGYLCVTEIGIYTFKI